MLRCAQRDARCAGKSERARCYERKRDMFIKSVRARLRYARRYYATFTVLIIIFTATITFIIHSIFCFTTLMPRLRYFQYFLHLRRFSYAIIRFIFIVDFIYAPAALLFCYALSVCYAAARCASRRDSDVRAAMRYDYDARRGAYACDAQR